jgi:hypothetical protein
MMTAADGVNAHRGAIVGMGLLCAAAEFREAFEVGDTLGVIIAREWGAISAGRPGRAIVTAQSYRVGSKLAGRANRRRPAVRLSVGVPCRP